MLYKSTRSTDKIEASKAIINGLADDGGLYVFDKLPSIEIEKLINKNFNDIMLVVLQNYFDNFDTSELKKVINSAYRDFSNNEITTIKFFENYGYLELFNGPTLAFKDLALSIFPSLLNLAVKKEGYQDKILIVTATSGDTGSAAMNAIANKENIEIVVLYPDKGTSALQKEQMQKQQASNVSAIGVNGNFDKAQGLVKKLFEDNEFKNKLKQSNYQLSSANSINIARLIPQIVYYIDAYLKLVNNKVIEMNDRIDIIVPTGNFGNILAAFLAKKMGLPAAKITCVSNENDVIYKFFKTGIYDIRRELIKTNTPSMDILVSSNLERFLYFVFEDEKYIAKLMNDLKNDGYFEISKEELRQINDEIYVGFCNKESTLKAIAMEYENHNYLIDPHTATAFSNLNNEGNYTLVVATASPFKFGKTIKEALNLSSDNIEKISSETKTVLPEKLMKLKELNIKHDLILDIDKVREYLIKEKVGV